MEELGADISCVNLSGETPHCVADSGGITCKEPGVAVGIGARFCSLLYARLPCVLRLMHHATVVEVD